MNIELLQNQFNRERYNAACYDALSAALENINWPGSAAWMHKAADEEREHAEKFAGYLIDRGQMPRLDAIPALPVDDADLTGFFNTALELERKNTALILAIYGDALATGDYQTTEFLGWAIAEQTSAERELLDILIELDRADCSAARLILDREYGKK